VFQDPVHAHIGMVLLTHHLGYFDILPLYVALMLMATVIVVVDRVSTHLLLALSFALYVTVLVTQFNLPSWPVPGEWFFNPLAWQLIFVLCFVMAKPEGVGAFVRRNIKPIRWFCLPIVIFFFLVVWFNWWHDPTRVPQPRLFFILHKTYETPIRLIQFLALIAVFSVAFPYIRRAVPPVVAFCSLLGRNSLYVFCMGSVLSLIGQIVRGIYRGNLLVETALVVVGIAIMAITAWLPEWRESIRQRSRSQQPASA
jgi:hypothetical protein